MKYELKITLFFLLTLFLTKNVLSQVSVTKSNVDFTLTLKQDSVYRILTFWKEKDSEIYTSVKYTVSDFSKLAAEKNLSDEIETINQLWIFSLDSIETDLQSFNIGYPLLYSDILNNQIQAFLYSDEWQKHVKSEFLI